MKCFRCKCKIQNQLSTDPSDLVDVCHSCLFIVDNTDEEDFYDFDLQNDIEAIVNKTGVTPARFLE